MPETKPVVIRIEDGETVTVEMLWRHYKTRLDFHADIRAGDEEDVAALHGVHVQGCLRGCFGPLSMRPDPVRAAELAERKRCKALAEKHLAAFPVVKASWLAAIDAPAEPPLTADGERGATLMRAFCLRELGKFPNRSVTDIIHNIRYVTWSELDSAAPDETVSEYENGWAFGVDECRGLVRALRDRVANTTSRHCGLPDLNQLANGMDGLLLSDTEPPR